jgi:hypothetical protein
MRIIPGLCPRWDVPDVMGIPWSTSSRTNSPPAGRYLDELYAVLRALKEGTVSEVGAIERLSPYTCT